MGNEELFLKQTGFVALAGWLAGIYGTGNHDGDIYITSPEDGKISLSFAGNLDRQTEEFDVDSKVGRSIITLAGLLYQEQEKYKRLREYLREIRDCEEDF